MAKCRTKKVHVAGKNRAAYSKEFREDIFRLHRSSGESIVSVAKELGIAG
jgi:transposase-like protein